MGLHFSRIWERMFGKKEMRILMVGLDAAGKVRETKEIARNIGIIHVNSFLRLLCRLQFCIS
jgi:hypothetical protein